MRHSAMIRHWLAAAVMLLPLTPARVLAQVSLPDTPAGRRFGEWLKVFNEGDRDRLLQFFQQHFPDRAKAIDQAMAMRRELGGYDLEAVEQASATEITCLLKTRTGGREVRAQMRVEPEAPHRIAAMRVGPADAQGPAGPPPARMDETAALAALRGELEKQAAADRFAGAVLVARNGVPIFQQAYGLADRERRVSNTLDTKFRLGSMNKMFTAVAVAQLAQAGKLHLNDPLGTYLPDYPNREVAAKVTIHQLLTHTGGTGDIFGPEFEAHRAELQTLKDYEALYGKRGLEFEPGSRWEYSNYGFVLLGLVIERVSGQSYYDYVRDHVYRPAGMRASGSEPESQNVPGRAVGYTRMNGPALAPNTETLPPRGTSAGGGYSTVGDLLAFANALQGHRLLDAAYTDTVTTGKVATPGNGKYAYGFGDHDEGGVRWFGHGGGAPGMNGVLRIYPGSGYVVAVLANLDPPAAEEIAAFIADRLPAGH